MTNKDVIYAATDATPVTMPEEGLKRQVLAYNPRLMLVRHLLAKGWKGTRHKHPHDQLVYVVRGAIVFSGGGRTVEMHDGDSLVVAGDVEHQAQALEEAEVLDVFTPYREDYAQRGACARDVCAAEGVEIGWCVAATRELRRIQGAVLASAGEWL